MTRLLLLLYVAVPGPTEVTVTRLSGPPVRGVLVGWDSSGTPLPAIRIQVEGKTVSLSTDQLIALRWGDRSSQSVHPDHYVELVDGSRLPLSMVGSLIEADDSPQILVTNQVATLIPAGTSKPLSIPTERLRGMQLMSAAVGADTLWREVRKNQLPGDVLVVRKRKDQSLDYLTGVVGDLTDSHLIFQWDGEKIPVKRSKVAALAYYNAKEQVIGSSRSQTLEESPMPICRLETSRGAVLMVARLSLIEDRLKIKTVCGVLFELPVEELISADYSYGKLVYLSDLKPQSVQWNPRIGLPFAATTIRRYGEPRNDAPFGPLEVKLPGTGRIGEGRERENSRLTLRWQSTNFTGNGMLKTYDKGLAIRSRTELVYQLPKGMRHFRAIAGIDPSTSTQGHVQLKITGDRGGKWEGPIDGNQPPVEINLDLQNSNRLTILVDYGKNLDWGDRLHLVDAQVTR